MRQLKIFGLLILFSFFLLILLSESFRNKFIVLSLIGGGKILYPESAAALQHYIWGNGDTLFLKSQYIERSPVVLKNLKVMKNGESRKIVFKQSEDWRLSYFINGFTLSKINNRVVIKQFILFDKSGKVHTDLNFYFFKIRLNDCIAHSFKDYKPYWVYLEFSDN